LAGGISPSVLLGWFQSFYGGSGTGGSALGNALTSGASPPPILYAPTPPWQASVQPAASQLVRQALGGAQLFNARAV
jgi:hypothetical protein